MATALPPTVVIDTREQHPYEFSSRVSFVRAALPAGDYSLEGLEHSVAVERKTAEDFAKTVIRGRERFRKELLKLQSYSLACIVVETDLESILGGLYGTGAHPKSVVGAAMSIIVDYGIPVYFCSTRQCARHFTEEFLLRAYRRIEDGQQTCPDGHQERSDATGPR